MQPRTCASGRNPDDAMTVPDFTDQYWNGAAIEEIAEAMIASFPELSWITEGEYRLVYFWKQKGGRKGETPIYGDAAKASGIAGHLTKATWHVWMAADHCKTLANYEFEAALFHQLLHLGEREIEDSDPDIAAKRIPVTKPHELEMFTAEIDRYGLWSLPLRRASESFHQQLKLNLAPQSKSKNGKSDDSFDTGGDEIERRSKQQIADEVTAKGDGSADILWDENRKEFHDRRGDIYAAGAVEEAAGVGAI